jgi:hypothetical protein
VSAVNEAQDEEMLQRRAREQADIERQADALVLRTLTALVTASEELKAKLRRDTEHLLDRYRQTKRQLEHEIAAATAERARSRRDAEQERAVIIAEARAQAREIVKAAERERESVLGRLGVTAAPDPARRSPSLTSVSDEGSEAAAESDTAPTSPAPSPAPSSTAPSVPVASLSPSPVPATSAPSWLSAFPTSPTSAYPPGPVPARRRPVELLFDGVPGYQQASALERAINDLLPDEEIDIIRFDCGQLVLGLQAADLAQLADRLVAGSRDSLELEAVDGDQARFRCM